MFSMSRSFKVGILALFVTLAPFLCIAADKEDADKKSNETAKPVARETKPTAFLGILVDELPPAFASQLPSVVSPEQGVLVVDVTPDSPAAKAGIKQHDILLTYDDQKLFAAEQLIKLVHSDKPGRKVNLELVRAGKQQKQQVALSERPSDTRVAVSPPSSERRATRLPWPLRRLTPSERPGWNSFDSMTLRKLDEKRFHASIQHTDKNGKLQKHEFEGTADEIHKQIMSDKDMLPNERTHLLRSLDLESKGSGVILIPEYDPLFDF